MIKLRVYPLDIIDANLQALARDLADLELKYILGNISKVMYGYEKMKITEKVIYFKHCKKLSERVVNN